ncbi:MAG: hypothetical protein V4787_11790 [Pseudomonadota bacterium]
MTLALLFMIVAIVLLLCAAFGVPSTRVSLGWLGLALWAIAEVTGGVVLRG